jgi:CHAT domain-containing protein
MVYTVTALGLPGGAGSADRLGPPRATAQTLYEWLFAPLREHVKTQAVLIASHQQLHYLPFSALHDGEQYLVEVYTVVYLPSASVLRPLACN